MTARGRSRCGLRDSPPSCTACSKPCSANITPNGSAANTPWAPKGANPPPAVKLPEWNDTVNNTMTVSTGTAIFHSIVTRLDSASHRTPRMFTTVNSAISTTAITRPRPVSAPEVLTSPGQRWSRYDSAASTSIGESVAACSQPTHPAVNPANAPNAIRGYRAVPPANGYVAASSAWTSASSTITAPASNHDNTDAPPATLAAVNAPNNHPDPIIEPSETSINAIGPTSRRNPDAGAFVPPIEMSVIVKNSRLGGQRPTSTTAG